ncbi:unnamed protein product [Dracunculus medinensis]|uniref:AWS domain-containing protein n=1 Tax=Dracunculus medinensis TaxID=318479 RepID=A0A0N4UN16_DRAME|nr:unnamed protein product [Dracunculus medinensis]
MRNVTHKDFFNKTRKRSNIPRYFRATIAEVDRANPDFMYRVYYWDDVVNVDAVSNDQWPDESCSCAWVSPYDIAPSTPDLSRRRNIVRRREMEYQCKCGYDFCELVFSEKCPFKLSQACCQRLKMNCPFHSKKNSPNEVITAKKLRSSNKRSSSTNFYATRTEACFYFYIEFNWFNIIKLRRRSLGISLSSDDTRRSISMKDIRPKWVYQNGRIVEVSASPTSIPDAQPQARVSHTDEHSDEHTPAKRNRLEFDRYDSSSDGFFDDDFEDDIDDELDMSIDGTVARAIPYHQLIARTKGVSIAGNVQPETSDVLRSVPCTITRSADRTIQRTTQSAYPVKFLGRSGNLLGATNRIQQKAVSNLARTTERANIGATTKYLVWAIFKISERDGIRKRVSAPPRRLSPNPA